MASQKTAPNVSLSKRPQFDRRASGLLLHITSLPGAHGSGDLGPAAHRFVDFLAAAGQRWWQMLPVVPPGVAPGYSPYSALSAFAGSPWMVSLEQLACEGLLARGASEERNSPFVDFRRVIPQREAVLRQAFDSFRGNSRRRADLKDYIWRERSWLNDWSLFAAMSQATGGRRWFEWERRVRLRDPAALGSARAALADEIAFHGFVQYQFDRQWTSLQRYCRARGVCLLGDLPIFVAGDSCDVWANPRLFALRSDGRPSAISGCPPDYFSKMGQLWNHPQYRWENHEKDGFAWWVSRFATELRRFDGLRVDHFIGFHRTWAIPGNAKDGRRGKWLISPGAELFAAVHKAVGPAPIIAEDLGVLTPEAGKLRDSLGMPGMRVMQFGFGDGGEYHLPHRFIERCVAYTGTHDNNTLLGWFADLVAKGKVSQDERAKVLAYLNSSPGALHRDMIRALLASVAQTVIFPVQDVLGLGGVARMNRPGTETNNWGWRLQPNQLTPAIAQQLGEMTALYERT